MKLEAAIKGVVLWMRESAYLPGPQSVGSLVDATAAHSNPNSYPYHPRISNSLNIHGALDEIPEPLTLGTSTVAQGGKADAAIRKARAEDSVPNKLLSVVA